MSYQPVSKIFDTLAQRHREASEALRRSDDNIEPGSRDSLLLQRLEAFESEVFTRLKDEQSNTSKEIQDTWIQYVPMEPVDEAIEKLRNAPPEQVLESLLEFHQAAIELLKTISEQVSSDKVSEFFESLTEVEENYSRQCAMVQVRDNEI